MVRPISDIRKPEIVQGAIAALQKHGLSMISYDLIAEEADMSRQLIRHYFPDGEQLMVAVCDAMAAAYKETLARGVVTGGVTERLPVFLDIFFNMLAGDDVRKPPTDSAYDAMMSIATGSEAVRKNLHDQYALLQHTISGELRISYPKMSQHACTELGYLFCALLYGHWRMVATLGFSEDHNKISRDAMDRLIESYRMRYEDPDLADLSTTTAKAAAS